MTPERVSQVVLRSWAEDDLPLLRRRLGDPAMMEHLGGPETHVQIENRHERYLAMNGGDQGAMLVMLVGGQPAGSIGYWEREWQGEQVWKTGWSVLPEAQGRGVAKAGVTTLLEQVRAVHGHRFVHAFPNTHNAPSNGLCRSLGFQLRGAVRFEFPKGHFMTCNDWISDLNP